MINWIRSLFCKHEYATRFRGRYFRGVECVKCGKADLVSDFNAGFEPEGWIEDR